MSTFLESPNFPINEVNRFSASEKKGGGRPDFWEMVFWWTRKPLIGARSVIAGALLPSNFSPFEFKRLVKLWPEAKSPHRENPSVSPQLKERFSRVKLLDPFAGFGSIPLEAMRLGVGEVVAVELLPTAYVFLKAVLEYPKEFGERLIKDVERWGKWVTERLREDPDVKELYDEDVAVYIGSWEVKCPHCGRYTPLVGNWWLARVPKRAEESEEEEGEGEGVKSGAFRRLAWMVPYTSSNAVGTRVIDLNKELGVREVRAKVSAKQGRVEASGKAYSVPKPNIDARREMATCLLCNNAIKGAGKGWYVKEALKEYNENLERYLRGEIALEDLLKSMARPRILVRIRVVNKELEFEPATSEDNEKLWKALEKLRHMWGDPDIPTEPLPPYGSRGMGGDLKTIIWGLDQWYKHFNPRQLLTLVKLVKLIRKAGKEIEEEFMLVKLYERAKEGVVYDSPEARRALRRLSEVIRGEEAKLYGIQALDIIKPSTMAEGLLKYSSKAFESVFDSLFKSPEVLKKPDEDALRRAKVRVLEEVVRIKHGENEVEEIRKEAFRYAEAITTYLAILLTNFMRYDNIVTHWQDSYWGLLKVKHSLAFRGIAITWSWCEFEPTLGIKTFMQYSIESLSYLVPATSTGSSKVELLCDDATSLNKLNDKAFDLIVTDPPYRDDVPYAELSDLYYVWLKRALSNVEEAFGVVKLAPRFHKEAFFDEWGNEIETQWKAFALKEISENEGRIRYFGVKNNALDHFKSLLSESFRTMASKLKDDGLLVTYYAHTSPEAWEALLEAGWLNAKMRVTAAHAIATESAESVVARGKIRLDMAIVAVWRKGVKGEALLDDVYAKAVEACSKDAHEYRKAGLEGVNLFVAVLGKVLSHFTQHERLIGLKATDKPLVRNLVENYIYPATAEAIARSYGAVGARLSPPSMFYLLSKVLIGRRPRQARRVLDRTSAVVLSIGTRSELKDLEGRRLLLREEDSYVLLEPRWGSRSPRDAIGDALTVRGLSPRESRISTAVDVLHLLEFYATTLPKEEFKRKADELRGKGPGLFDEAVALARVLASSLPVEDPERELTKQVVEALGLPGLGTLDSFIRR